MPVDPRFNEKQMHRMLSDTDVGITPEAARSLCSAVLIDCYDRKVEVEFFEGVVENIERLLEKLSEIDGVARMMQALYRVDPNRVPEQLLQEANRLAQEFNVFRRKLGEKVELVMQCPTTKDKIS